MSAPESLKRLRQMGHGAASGTENTPKLSRERRMMSPSEKSTNNSRLSGSCADLPLYYLTHNLNPCSLSRKSSLTH